MVNHTQDKKAQGIVVGVADDSATVMWSRSPKIIITTDEPPVNHTNDIVILLSEAMRRCVSPSEIFKYELEMCSSGELRINVEMYDDDIADGVHKWSGRSYGKHRKYELIVPASYRKAFSRRIA